jgi:hypothetical protein
LALINRAERHYERTGRGDGFILAQRVIARHAEHDSRAAANAEETLRERIAETNESSKTPDDAVTTISYIHPYHLKGSIVPWPDSSPDADRAALVMLLDERIGGDLLFGRHSPQPEALTAIGSSSTDTDHIYVFDPSPSLTVDQVRADYGKWCSFSKEGLSVVTCGYLRLIFVGSDRWVRGTIDSALFSEESGP